MLSKGICGLVIFSVAIMGMTSAFALTELERATISDPRLENAFGISFGDHINAQTQLQISADITNHQEKSQDFVYLVQVKNEIGIVEKIGWVSGNLAPHQKLEASLSWTPEIPGTYTTEIFAWEGLVNHNAIAEYREFQIMVS